MGEGGARGAFFCASNDLTNFFIVVSSMTENKVNYEWSKSKFYGPDDSGRARVVCWCCAGFYGFADHGRSFSVF